jgi:hypothetical protein
VEVTGDSPSPNRNSRLMERVRREPEEKIWWRKSVFQTLGWPQTNGGAADKWLHGP